MTWSARLTGDDHVVCGRCPAHLAERKRLGTRTYLVMRPGYRPDETRLWRIADEARERRNPTSQRSMLSYESEKRVMWDELRSRDVRVMLNRPRSTGKPPSRRAPAGRVADVFPMTVRCYNCQLVQEVLDAGYAVPPDAPRFAQW